MAQVNVNSNFHTATATSVFDLKKTDKRFQEYRRRWHQNPAGFISGKFPIHLDIESTSLCNLRCPFCASTVDNWGPSGKGFIDFGLYKRIIDEGVRNELFSIKLSLRGEPLLHSKLVEMIKYAKQSGIIDVYFNTNAVLLSPELINDLIDSGLDRISISFEGIDSETYQKYRVGAKFDEVFDNIKNLKNIKSQRGSLAPQVRIQTVLLPELKEGFADYVKFWQPFADEVSYLDARSETLRDYHCQQQACSDTYEGRWACPFLWQRMMIMWDGSCYPCLLHGVKDVEEMKLGNANKDSLRQMWNSQALNEIRRMHKEGKSHKIKACNTCSYRAMELDKLNKENK